MNVFLMLALPVPCKLRFIKWLFFGVFFEIVFGTDLGHCWAPFWGPFGIILGVFFEANFDTNLGSYFGRCLVPFWTLSGVLSDLVEHLKTMQKPWFFTCFMAIPGFTRDSKGHEKHVKYRSSFVV